jgi:hypothetical protein
MSGTLLKCFITAVASAYAAYIAPGVILKFQMRICTNELVSVECDSSITMRVTTTAPMARGHQRLSFTCSWPSEAEGWSVGFVIAVVDETRGSSSSINV